MENRYRVYNVSTGFIGGKLSNGLEFQIAPGGMTFMTADDILFVEAARMVPPKFFGDGYLVARNEKDQVVNLSSFMGVMPSGGPRCYTQDEMLAAIKGSAKALKEMCSELQRDSEQALAFIELVKSQDIATSKLKIIKEAFPWAQLL